MNPSPILDCIRTEFLLGIQFAFFVVMINGLAVVKADFGIEVAHWVIIETVGDEVFVGKLNLVPGVVIHKLVLYQKMRWFSQVFFTLKNT